MIELEDVDLAQALYRLSRMCARYAADIPMEMADSARGVDLATVLEETARALRAWTGEAPPMVIDAANPVPSASPVPRPGAR